MACFGNNGCGGRCPGCGAVRRNRRSVRNGGVPPAPTRETACEQGQAFAPGRPGCPFRSTAQELYIGPREENRIQPCCDPYNGCGPFPQQCRNDFWPGFCHPRWLPCQQLYDGRRRGGNG